MRHQPSAAHTHVVFSPEYEARRPDPERWTAIWSRWPLVAITDPAAHRRGTVAALVACPSGDMIVYGTVIAYAGEPHENGDAALGWEIHKREIARQCAEWTRLRAAYPKLPLVVAGDFNQNRDGAQWYGSKDVRARLGAALERAGLTCVTVGDMVANGQLKAHHLVDHICLTPGLAAGAEATCRENVDASGQRLSDHPVVIVNLA